MEVYEYVEGNAFNVCDASDALDATTAMVEDLNQPAQIEGIEVEGNQLVSLKALKATSGNAEKRLRTRQEIRSTTNSGKKTGAATRPRATQERLVEKERMKAWKQVIMQEVEQEMQAIRKGYEEALETQRHEFQTELKRVNGRLDQIEARSTTSVNDITVSKAQKMAATQRSTQDTTKTQDTPKTAMEPAAPGSSHPVHLEKQRSYATVAAAKPVKAPSQPWIKVSYENRRNGSKKPSAQLEKRGCRILFPRKDRGQFKSEADIILALNEALQKAGIKPKIRFTRVKYAPSGSISALLTEKADATMLLPQQSNMLIRAAKTIDDAVIGVKVLEQWHRLKVHGMSLERYLGQGNMELLKREVESSTGIPLKAIPRWLISENWLQEQQENNDKRGSAIVITVSNEIEAKRSIASGLRFGGAVKKVEKYWDAGPGSVCMKYCGIGHERQGDCGDRPEKCILCAGAHPANEHQCGVDGCKIEKGKLCVHITARCANFPGNH